MLESGVDKICQVANLLAVSGETNKLVIAYAKPKTKCAMASHRTHTIVRPRDGLTTPYPMHTISSRKKENELRKAFRTATITRRALAPTFEPFLFK